MNRNTLIALAILIFLCLPFTYGGCGGGGGSDSDGMVRSGSWYQTGFERPHDGSISKLSLGVESLEC